MIRNDVNSSWNLESFLDSLIEELDKARETLAVKAFNKPLTYSVKDMAMELQLFPSYDGRQVKFVTAKPGETGASKVSIQLGSITDRQIRETSSKPISRDDISIEDVEEIDPDTKTSLRRLGIKSVQDIKNLESRNVDIERVTSNRVGYNKLAAAIERARRNRMQPSVSKVSVMKSGKDDLLYIEGSNLLIDGNFKPSVMINEKQVKVKKAGTDFLAISMTDGMILKNENKIKILLDPETAVEFNIKS